MKISDGKEKKEKLGFYAVISDIVSFQIAWAS